MANNGKQKQAKSKTNPLVADGNGRDGKGKFAPGNRFGKGSGHNVNALRFKSVLYDCITQEDFIRQAERVKALAFEGEEWAVKLLWAYLMGKPSQPVEHGGDVNLTVSDLFRVLRDARRIA